MPTILVRLPEGVLDAASKGQLVRLLNTAAVQAEQIADHPRSRAMCWVLLDEVKPGNWTCGGVDASAALIPVMLQTWLPAGVLDAPARARYAETVQAALASVLRDERRQLMLSSVVIEVPEGQWAINGRPWALADFARHAGYAHLQHLVPA